MKLVFCSMLFAVACASDSVLRGNERRLDSICGSDARFMATLKCNDGSMLRFCAPNNLDDRDSFCENPNEKWAEAKCKKYGGFDELVTHLTGCYAYDKALCGRAPYDMSDAGTSVINGGFEDGVLEPWVWKPTEGIFDCFGDPAVQPEPQILNDGGNPEGDAYLRIESECTSPNSVTRSDVIVGTDGGCGTGVQVSFWYKFETDEFDCTGCVFSDCMEVSIEGNGQSFLSLDICVSEIDSNTGTPWTQKSIDLGIISAGSNLSLSIVGSVTDSKDCIYTSFLLLDGLEISYYQLLKRVVR